VTTTPVYSALVPMLPVSDVPRAIAFYEQLGFRIGNTHAPRARRRCGRGCTAEMRMS
jgi:hypothetical protein